MDESLRTQRYVLAAFAAVALVLALAAAAVGAGFAAA